MQHVEVTDVQTVSLWMTFFFNAETFEHVIQVLTSFSPQLTCSVSFLSERQNETDMIFSAEHVCAKILSSVFRSSVSEASDGTDTPQH